MNYNIHVRTTLDIPVSLIEEARGLLGYKSRTVITALREMIRLHKMKELEMFHGQVDIEIDIDASRRRPKK